MKTTFILCLAALLAPGCARFRTVQLDRSYEDGILLREVKTTTTVYTFMDSDSQLGKLETEQDDANQVTKVGSLGQTSTSESVDKIAEGITTGIMKAMAP